MGFLHCLRSERHRGFLEHSPVDGTINLHGIFSQPWRWGASPTVASGSEFLSFFFFVLIYPVCLRDLRILRRALSLVLPNSERNHSSGIQPESGFRRPRALVALGPRLTTFLATSSICTLYPHCETYIYNFLIYLNNEFSAGRKYLIPLLQQQLRGWEYENMNETLSMVGGHRKDRAGITCHAQAHLNNKLI